MGHLGRLAAALITPNTAFQLECSAWGRDCRTCGKKKKRNILHVHVLRGLLLDGTACSCNDNGIVLAGTTTSNNISLSLLVRHCQRNSYLTARKYLSFQTHVLYAFLP